MHHGFAKATLFLSVGLSSELKPGNKLAPYLWLLILIPALSLIGLPLSSGAFAKAALKEATSSWSLFATMLTMSAIGTSVLMCRFVELMKQQAASATVGSATRWGLILPTALSALMCLGYFYTRESFELSNYKSITSSLSWSAIWPALAGALLIVATSRLRAKVPAPAAGDLLMVYQKIAQLLQQSVTRIIEFNISIARDISILFSRSKGRSITISSRLGKQLVIDTPGTVLMVILAALLLSFLT
jgi:multicomponent Na+:H+ antiporter subunit D